LKREHNLIKAKKRGLNRVYEECLLSALALNLKRMIKAGERPLNTALFMNSEELIGFLCKISGIAYYCVA
jgi:hypothetical protein